MRATKRGGCTCIAKQRGDDGHGDEQGQEEEGQAGITVREQDGHRHDGAELPEGTHRQEGRSDRRAQRAGVAQDGEQRPERGGGQAERHHDRVEDQACRVQRDADGKGEDHRGAPGSGREPQVPLPHDRQVELGARQEHEVGEAEVGQRRHDGVGVREREHVWADEDPEEDLDHHFGNRQEPATPLGDDRCQHCGHADQDQRGDGVFDHRPQLASNRLPWHPFAASWPNTLRAAPLQAGDVADPLPG